MFFKMPHNEIEMKFSKSDIRLFPAFNYCPVNFILKNIFLSNGID